MINKITCGLKYPPLKSNMKKVPEKVVYYQCFLDKIHDFRMCTTSKPYYYSNMYCTKANQFLGMKILPSLCIAMLESKPRKKGLGTEMLKLAERFSKQIGCEGRFHLCADPQFTKDEAPHLFYRRFGMNTEYAETNRKMDEFIALGKNATAKDFPSMLMYYPPVETKNSKVEDNKLDGFFNSLMNFFRIF